MPRIIPCLGKRTKIEPIVDLNVQTLPTYEDTTPVRYSPVGARKDSDEVVNGKFVEPRTLLDLIYRGYSISPNGDCIGERDFYSNNYVYMSYSNMIKKCNSFASGLLLIGLKPTVTRIGIFSVNSSNWTIAQFAAYHSSMIVVPIADNISTTDYIDQMKLTKIHAVIVDSLSRTEFVIKMLKHTPTLSTIISMSFDAITDHVTSSVKAGVSLYSFNDILDIGSKFKSGSKIAFVEPTPDSIAEICFTSGTSGKPKAVVLTHGNYINSIVGVIAHVEHFINFSEETLLSFIPVAHSLGLIAECIMYYSGGRVAMFSGEISSLIQDMKDVRPSVLVTIPRLLDNIYNRICYSVKGNLVKTKLMALALESVRKEYDSNSISEWSIFDTIVFKKARKGILGGNTKLIINGGDVPLSPNVHELLRCALKCAILDSYGTIETAGIACLSHFGDFHSGHSGSPLPNNFIKLVDVPETGQSVNDSGVGEICIKGSSVACAYVGPNDVIPSIDEDGWFKTGDIGSFTPNGSLVVLIRKNSIFMLKSGAQVAPENLEGIYQQSSFVSQCFVTPDLSEEHNIAIVVPEIEYLNRWCVDNNVIMNTEQACTDLMFHECVLNDMLSTGYREGVHQDVQVKDIYLIPRPFSVSDGLLTSSQKLKRKFAQIYFHEIIKEMTNRLRANSIISIRPRTVSALIFSGNDFKM